MRSRLARLLGLGLSLTACGRGGVDGLTTPDAQAPVPIPPLPIVAGEFDAAGVYPFVGALMLDWNSLTGDGVPDGLITAEDQWCTGSLVARNRTISVNGTTAGYDVVLTAGHCLALAPTADLFFSFAAILPGSPIAVSATILDPRFGGGLGDSHDLALLLLPAGSAAGVAALARLPAAGALDALVRQNRGRGGLVFVNVGYGTQAFFKGAPPLLVGSDRRRVSQSPFMGLRKAWLGLLMNADATGLGGDCFGDSGSPKLLAGGDGETIYATVTSGDAICRATSWDYRLDTKSARDFLGAYLPRP